MLEHVYIFDVFDDEKKFWSDLPMNPSNSEIYLGGGGLN